jgi:Leucine-rich repeat (LRR) protein
MSSLDNFKQLQTLVLDHNQLRTITSLPRLPSLRALSLNGNELTDLHRTLIAIQRNCPNITFLSLLENPCYPCELTSSSYQVCSPLTVPTTIISTTSTSISTTTSSTVIFIAAASISSHSFFLARTQHLRRIHHKPAHSLL